MTSVFVLINTDLGAEEQTLEQLRRLESVEEVHRVCGVFDLVVRVHTDSLDKIREIVSGEVYRLEKVRSALAMVVAE